MVSRRPLPRTPWPKVVGVVAAFSIGAGLFAWLSFLVRSEWLMVVPFLAAIPIGNYFFTVERCPVCDQPLMTYREPDGFSTAYRVLSRCGQCEIDWDTGILGDTRYDD